MEETNFTQIIESMPIFACKDYSHKYIEDKTFELNILGYCINQKVSTDYKPLCSYCFDYQNSFYDLPLKPSLQQLADDFKNFKNQQSPEFIQSLNNLDELKEQYKHCKETCEKIEDFKQDQIKRQQKVLEPLLGKRQRLLKALIQSKGANQLAMNFQNIFNDTHLENPEDPEKRVLKWNLITREEKELVFIANRFHQQYCMLKEIEEKRLKLVADLSMSYEDVLNQNKSLDKFEFQKWNWDQLMECEREMKEKCQNNCDLRISKIKEEDFLAGELSIGSYVTYYKTGYAIGSKFYPQKGVNSKGCASCDSILVQRNEKIFQRRTTIEYY